MLRLLRLAALVAVALLLGCAALSAPAAAQEDAHPDSELARALSGKAPGVALSDSTGPSATGAGGGIVVRTGGGSLFRGNEPLYVIDGVRVPRQEATAGRSPLGALNPSDIISIEVLKDEGALARYGRDAEHGVVLITTRFAPSAADPAGGPFPNPVLDGGEVTVPDVPEGFESAEVIDARGRRVAVVRVRAASGVVVPTDGLPAGVYLVRLRGTTERTVQFTVR